MKLLGIGYSKDGMEEEVFLIVQGDRLDARVTDFFAIY
jgi:hypothetical protein